MSQNYDDCILVARSELMLARRQLNDEITNYPTPISGCDAQFNHLLAEREKVRQALRALGRTIFVPTPRALTPLSGIESR